MGKMRVTKKLMVSVGEYENRDGEKKKEWCQVGIMMQDEEDPDRVSLKFVMPLPMTDNNKGYAECWVNAYPIDNNNSNTSSGTPPTRSEPSSPPPSSNYDDGSAAPSPEDDAIDDIPF